jgi:hypothetical protein
VGRSATLTNRMTRGTVVAVWAAIGAAIGAVVFLPVGYVELDGPPDCPTCTAELRTVLMGAHFPTPYNAPLMAALGAFVLGTVFALAAWGLTRIFSDQLP